MKQKGTTRILLVVLALCLMIPAVSFQSFAKKDGKTIVVSMGDSYSSGEGIEPFYDAKDYEDHDFLAHRSKLSWPGQLEFNGKTLERYDEDTNPDGTWYFVASSGAETIHFNSKKQVKKYDRDGVSGSKELDKQLDVFSRFEKNEVDYVTMTIGGNDLGFTDVIAAALVEGNPILCPALLLCQLEQSLDALYKGGVDEHIRQVYTGVRLAAGEDTVILVAGYPRLIADIPKPNKSFTVDEALLINSAVSLFNYKLEAMITEMRETDKNIYFVSVEEEFKGHEAYSYKESYINPMMSTQKYDLEEFDLDSPKAIFSSYSMHPNKEGAKAYARCVQRMIDTIEKEALSNEEVSNNITKTITQKDIDSLENILNRYHFISEYDYSKMNMEKLIDGYISSGCSLPAHEEYFDSSRRSRSNIYQTPDPQGLIFTDFYYTVAESDIKWLAENVFNVSYKQVSNKKQVTLTSVAGIHSTNGFLSYYDSGKYYLSAQNCQSTLAQDFVVKSYSLINGGKYRILVDYYENFFDEPKAYVTTLEIVAEVRVTDKIRHWSFYTIKVASEGANKNTASDWVSAYREFLTDYTGDENTEFALCYIDDDNIPELVISTDGYHYGGANIYNYHNGTVEILCEDIGQWGYIDYLEHRSIFYNNSAAQGHASYAVYKISNGVADIIWQGSDNLYDVFEFGDQPECYSFGTKVTVEEYEELLDKYYCNETPTHNDERYLLTKENINKYVTE